MRLSRQFVRYKLVSFYPIYIILKIKRKYVKNVWMVPSKQTLDKNTGVPENSSTSGISDNENGLGRRWDTKSQGGDWPKINQDEVKSELCSCVDRRGKGALSGSWGSEQMRWSEWKPDPQTCTCAFLLTEGCAHAHCALCSSDSSSRGRGWAVMLWTV